MNFSLMKPLLIILAINLLTGTMVTIYNNLDEGYTYKETHTFDSEALKNLSGDMRDKGKKSKKKEIMSESQYEVGYWSIVDGGKFLMDTLYYGFNPWSVTTNTDSTLFNTIQTGITYLRALLIIIFIVLLIFLMWGTTPT